MNTAIRFKQQEILKITLFFLNNYTVNLFRAALYKLIFVSHEDALFHCVIHFNINLNEAE